MPFIIQVIALKTDTPKSKNTKRNMTEISMIYTLPIIKLVADTE